jgi:hypothetical protein
MAIVSVYQVKEIQNGIQKNASDPDISLTTNITAMCIDGIMCPHRNRTTFIGNNSLFCAKGKSNIKWSRKWDNLYHVKYW